MADCVAVHGWQMDKCVLERNVYMLEHRVAADVSFIVGSPDSSTVEQPLEAQKSQKCMMIAPAGSSTVETIEAHKYMLIAGSPVFEAMFSGGLAETGPVKVPDVEPEVFKQLLRHIYSEKADITTSNVTMLLYAGRKYMLGTLVEQCTEFLEESLAVDNACMLCENTLIYQEDELSQKCMEFIGKNALSVLHSQGFLALSKDALANVVDSEYLACEEIDIFEACVRWAETQCQKNSLDLNDTNLREQLGPVLYCIRFPSMDPKELASRVTNRGILTAEESLQILRYKLLENTTEKPKLEFRSEKRACAKVDCVRFASLKDGSFEFCRTITEQIIFTVNQNCYLAGIGLYGAYKMVSTTEAQIKVLHKNVYKPILEVSKKYSSDGTSNPVAILFKVPVRLTAYEQYRIEVDGGGEGLEHEFTWAGLDGKVEVTCGGLAVRFMKSPSGSRDTNVEKGQIPVLYFKELDK